MGRGGYHLSTASLRPLSFPHKKWGKEVEEGRGYFSGWRWRANQERVRDQASRLDSAW